MSIADVATAPLLRDAPHQRLDDIVNDSLPAVKYLASRLALRVPSHVDVDDLIQVGIIGLLQSADRFDPRRGVKFQTYANRRIQGAMLDYLRSLDWKPRSVRRRSRWLEKAYQDASQRLGTQSSIEDVAQEIGIGVPELEQWKQASTLSSSQHQWEEISSTEYLARAADPSDSPEAALEKEQMRNVLVRAIDHLPENERLVLSLYYYEELTMEEIGQLLGVKQARISQLHGQAVVRLRKALKRSNRAGRERGINPAPLARAGSHSPGISLLRSAAQAALAPAGRRRTPHRIPAFSSSRQAERTA